MNDEYISNDSCDTVGHGSDVLNLLAAFAPEARYSTYQIIDKWEEDGEVHTGANRGNTIDAIIDAVDDGVDILNLSIGAAQDCNGHCSLCREVDYVAEDEVCAIASTGNKDKSGKRVGVHCPAVTENVIGVGGFISECTHEPVESDESSQWWLHQSDEIFGPFCGYEGCCNGSECSEYRRERLWGGNVSFHNAAPDILAPPFGIYGSELNDVKLQAGTSFSAPIVAGLLASMVGDIEQQSSTPSPRTLRSAVINEGEPIEDGFYCKFDCESTWEYLKQTVMSQSV